MQVTQNQPVINSTKAVTLVHSRRPTYRYHPTVWVLWLLAVLTPAMLTQNPFYLLLIILMVSLNYSQLDQTSPVARGWGAFLRLGVILVGFSLVFNLLFVNAGTTHLFTLPELRWEMTTEQGQTAVVQLGGKVSLESLVYGLTTGLALLALLLTFATFNTQVDHYQLLRSLPSFLYQSAIVMSIAITFIPHLFLAQQEIREAQALRGHRFRRVRDLLPLFVTLLAEGLERSLTLAESMEARGFGRQAAMAAPSTGLWLKSLLALALMILISGAAAWSYLANRLFGGVMILLGLTLLVAGVWGIGRNIVRSRYRRLRWQRPDMLVAAASLILMLVFLLTWLLQRRALIFYPYPSLGWPAFAPYLALTLLLIAAPGFVSRLVREKYYD